MVLKGKQRLVAKTDRDWHSLGKGCLTISPPQDGFSGIGDDADEALEISQAQLLYESRHKGQQLTPPPSGVKMENKPPPCQDEAPERAEAPSGTEAATGPGGEERDDSSDSDSSSSEGEER